MPCMVHTAVYRTSPPPSAAECHAFAMIASSFLLPALMGQRQAPGFTCSSVNTTMMTVSCTMPDPAAAR
ncbi:hypothetical protein HaLaN_29183 [Haematococcus lacustris]|uniref:Uncharacterized protein n=1 Tax=Haematococcus lacustris TaxID=44745 RepID=A0A6A0ACD3_HAELA|nr:hypothetical protein HaLaN_29183 [Haematococcus lacustris]